MTNANEKAIRDVCLGALHFMQNPNGFSHDDKAQLEKDLFGAGYKIGAFK